MHKLTVALFCFIIFFQKVSSQNFTVSGTVKDTTEKKQINNAVIALLTVKDSILYRFTRSDADGNFSIRNIPAGKYILITTHPYFADFLDNIDLKDNDLKLGTLSLISKTKLLQEVIVKSGSPIKIKGDTTIYTADSFKVSANANVEELLKKLPGIQVDKNGQIKAMGQTVEKVLVDGEEFFGDDPGMAVKNLRADAVKEVQVFDKKSDQAEFTGIDDGKTKKTINLKLKDDKKKGYFGKVDIAGGPQQSIDNRYNSNIMLSSFKGKRKISGFILHGNTGQEGLGWQDSEKFGSGESDNFSLNMDDNGNINFNWVGGNNDDEPNINTDDGYIKNTNAGIQYSNKINNKKTINISPKYNSQIYTNNNSTFTQTQYTGDSILNTNSIDSKNVNRNNLKNSLIYDIKLDSNNSIKFTSKVNFYHTESNDQSMATTSLVQGVTASLLNTTNRYLQTNSDKTSYSTNILFKHRFKKNRRTFSLNTDWNLLNTTGNNYLQSQNNINSGGVIIPFQNLNQNKKIDRSVETVSLNLTYTEPLSKKYSLELSHRFSYNNGTNNQLTYSYSNLTGKYDLMVDSLSNQFKQIISVNRPGVMISYNDKKIKCNFGSAFGFTHFDLVDKSFNKDYVRDYVNFFPTTNFNYTYKSNHNLRINYDGNSNQPTLNQLQPLKNNDNYFNQYIGNPNLKPSFTNNFRLSHNIYDFLKELNTYQSINIRTVANSITNNTITDLSTGKTTTQPVNTEGNYSINFDGGIWHKLKKIDLEVSINPNMSFNKYAGFLNNQKIFSKTLNTGISIYLSKEKEKKYDISLSNNFSYIRNITSQNNAAKNFNTNNIRLDATVYYKKDWSIITDYNFFMRQKTVDFQDHLITQIWNAKLQHTFKKDEFTFYILVRDILNQNIGIERNFSENSLMEQRNERLKRYGMIGFVWNFKNKMASVKK